MQEYIVSARKYRPSTFAQVVGQESITSTLKNSIINNHLAQAFLFTGPRGVGKTTCARILAKTINCLNPTPDGEPCNECDSCKAFNENASFNIHELDAASNNSVDDIRNLVDQVRIPPQAGKYKVYIIDEVHMLSSQAFNAFLKTLEEPPSYAKFILATTEKQKIIPTILSRCQIFDFKRIGVEDIAKHLAYVARNEGVEAEEDALHVIAEKSDGALRDALSTFDQIVSFSGNKITYKDVIENLNILDYDYYFKVTDSISKQDTAEALLIFNEIMEHGFDGQEFITGLTEHFRNLLVAQNPRTVRLLEISKSVVKRYEMQAQQYSKDFLFKALDITNRFDLSYKTSNNKRLHVEIAITQLINLAQTVNGTPAKPENPSYIAGTAIRKEETGKATAHEIKEEVKKPVNYAAKEQEEKNTQAENQSTGSVAAERVSTYSRKDNKSERLNTNKKMPVNISLKKTMEELKKLKRERENQKNTEVPVVETPFTQEQLEEAWKSFVVSYKQKSPSFSNTLETSKPELKEKFTITFTVPNVLFVQDQLNMMALKTFLAEKLQNNQIRLNPVVAKADEIKTAYTDRERFQKLQEDFPQIAYLKDKFRLELGY